MRSRSGKLLLTLLLLVLPRSAEAVTYYVNKNGSDADGLSAATAFTTIQKAAKTAKAGDTVIVAAGTYKEWIKSNNDGTESARIRFVSEPRWAAKIQPIKDALHFWTSNGDYVDIEGFTLDSEGAEVPHFLVRGIAAMGAHSRVMYNNIRLFRACTPELYYRGGVGIGTGSYTTNIGTEVFGNVIQNTRVPGCALPPKYLKSGDQDILVGLESAGYGIYGSTPKVKIYNNTIFSFRLGIHLWHAPSEAVVSHNLVFNNGALGIIFGCGDAPHVTCEKIVVSNNIFMRNHGDFIIREYGANVAASNQIRNNILFENESDAIQRVDDAVLSGNLIGVDPKLVHFLPNASGNFRLTAGSPAIDAASEIGAVAIDMDETMRPVGGAADIGPYEYGGDPPAAPTGLQIQ